MGRHITFFVIVFVLLNIKYSNASFNDPEPCLNRSDFQCKNGQCIDLTKECNGAIDCADKSDELDCGTIFFLLITFESDFIVGFSVYKLLTASNNCIFTQITFFFVYSIKCICNDRWQRMHRISL